MLVAIEGKQRLYWLEVSHHPEHFEAAQLIEPIVGIN